MAFSQEELIPCGEEMTLAGVVPRYRTPITPKENFLRMLKHENPLWIPSYFDTTTFVPCINPDNTARAFVIENEKLPPEKFGGKDMFGVDWEFVPTVGGSMVRPGQPLLENMNEWKDKVHFPNLDAWDWEECAKRNENFNDPDKPKVIWFFNGFFERLISFLEFENAAVAMIDEEQQDAVHEFFGKLTDFYIEILKRYKEYFGFDILYFHDDWGSQRAPFFSPDVAREMIAPYLKRIVDFCHDNDSYFEFHCCGKNEKMVPVMIECGVDIWAGQIINDKKQLYDEYGDKIILGVDTPLKANASDEEAYAAAEQNMKDFAMEYPQKAVYFCDLRPQVKHREYQYVLSRQILDKEA